MRRFDDHTFDPSTGELWYFDQPIPLQGQPAKLLAVLTANPGQMVSRDQLRLSLWDDTAHVDFDRCMNFYIRQLRIALGDDADSPRFIETLPKRGYRFLADVQSDAETAAHDGGEPKGLQPRSLVAILTLSL